MERLSKHTKSQPTEPSNRIAYLDSLRGLALCGICICNGMIFSGYPLLAVEHRSAMLFYEANSIFEVVIHHLLIWKFLVIFSLLFGVGIRIMAQRLEKQGLNAFKYLIRRLLALLVLGLLHLILWNGDILHWYAILGLLSLVFMRCRGVLIVKAGVSFGAIGASLLFYLLQI